MVCFRVRGIPIYIYRASVALFVDTLIVARSPYSAIV